LIIDNTLPEVKYNNSQGLFMTVMKL